MSSRARQPGRRPSERHRTARGLRPRAAHDAELDVMETVLFERTERVAETRPRGGTAWRPRRRTPSWLPTVGGLAIVGLAALVWWSTAGDRQQPRTLTPVGTGPRAVIAARVRDARASAPMRFHGVTRSAHHAVLSFPGGGRVVERPATAGMRVEAGAVLARADEASLRHALAAAHASRAEVAAQLRHARTEERRAASLRAADAGSQQALDAARGRAGALAGAARAAATGVREARRALEDAALLAPFDGIVTAVHVEPGEVVGAGQPVVELSGESAIELHLRVPESAITGIALGQLARVDLPLLDRAGLRARVTAVGRAASDAGLFPVTIALIETEGVVPGMSAEVELAMPTAPGLAVPLAAVIDPAGRAPSVLVVRDGRATAVPVTLRALHDASVIVDGELRLGELVVAGGHAFVLDGDPVDAHVRPETSQPRERPTPAAQPGAEPRIASPR